MDFDNRKFYRSLFLLAMPMAFQELISSAINMLDTFMIGRLGEAEVTAVGLANQLFMLYASLLFGVNSASAIFIAQFWGKKDKPSIHKVMGISISLSLFVCCLFMFSGFMFPDTILSIFSKDPQVIEIGAGYLKVVVFCFPFIAVSFTFRTALRSSGEAKLPVLASTCALLANALFNAIFIFGLLGFPRLNAIGAGIATIIARMFEMIVILYCSYKFRFDIAGKIKNIFSFQSDFVKVFFKTAVIVIINETLWAIGTSMYHVCYKQTGTNSQAAMQISSTFINLFFMFTAALGSASGILLGNFLGAGQRDLAIRYCKKYLYVIPLTGAVAGLCLIAIANAALPLFNVSLSTVLLIKRIIMIAGLYMGVKGLNHLIIVGVLRCGGDAFYSFLIDISSVWIVGLPMAFLGAYVWKLPIYYIYALVCLEDICRALFGVKRTLSLKWAKNIVNEME